MNIEIKKIRGIKIPEKLDSEVKKDIMRKVATAMQNKVKYRFHKGVDPEGNAWNPLKGRDGKPLRDTGRLLNSLTTSSDDNTSKVGTNTKYARIHNDGGVIKARNGKYLRFKTDNGWVTKESVNIPKRQFMGFDDDLNAKIRQIIRDGIKEKLNNEK